MPVIAKHYSLPFVAEKTKIDRILKVAKERLDEHRQGYVERFQISLLSGRVLETSLSDDLFSLDNSERNRIQGVEITCATEDAAHKVSVEFDGKRNPETSVHVWSENFKWASETLDEVEEQVERTLHTVSSIG